MNKTRKVDFCILGGGLAGVSLAGSLQKKGASVCVIDSGKIASGASGTPLGLVNPATGRFGTKSWNAEECYHSLVESLEEAQNETNTLFFKKSGVLRPALDAKIASRMRENFQTTDWPSGWCQWLDQKEMHHLNKDIQCVEGGLWLPVGLTVDVAAYLVSKAALLEKRGVIFKENADYEIQESRDRLEIVFGDGNRIQSQKVIFTAGIDTSNTTFWNFLPLIPVKGQIAVFKSPSPLSFDYAISALGYIASLEKNTFVIGSTYEHTFDHRDADAQGLEYLSEKMAKVYPKLIHSSRLVRQWAGVRASTPNRMPILGQHPEKENIFVYAGLGSKGLLYSTYLANIMSDFLISSKKLPDEVSLSRCY
ncbi:MAG: FAD-dependent oxidoreductase [Balneolaceae bacterium]